MNFRQLASTLLFLIATTSALPTSGEASCLTGQEACAFGGRSYHVLPPENWDGKTPLPVMLYFHGWGRQGHVPVNHKHIGKATSQAGILLVAPDGLGKSWDFWRPGSRDTGFAIDVLEEVSRHYPVNPELLYVSGYSWGASMAWRFSCEAGDRVTALLSISGTLYDQDETCETGPVTVHHVHGLKDTVMDYPYGPDGGVEGPVRLWRQLNGCEAAASISQWQTSQKFTRHTWSDCNTGHTATLDIHGGGHWIARGWLAQKLTEILGN